VIRKNIFKVSLKIIAAIEWIFKPNLWYWLVCDTHSINV
jgi:hypothetical protein